ncbi:MAG: NAD(P)/FAD-dependent oxidoreductase [Haloferacaceae archaeon]
MTRVAVVGGGIVGFASAYYLAERGAEVTVLEQGRIGHGSTPRAGGGIREQFSTPVSVALSRRSVEVWESFEERFGVDIDYRRHGYLYLARERATAERLREAVAFHDDQGVPSRYVAPEETVEYCAGIRTEQYAGGTYCPTDGYADPERALQGFALAAAREGVEVRLGRRVTDVLTEGGAESGRVTGVATDGDRVEADYVVNAAGAWAPAVAGMAGVELDVRPSRRQLAVVAPATPLDPSGPFVTDLDTGTYFRPEDERLSYVGGHVGEDRAVDPDGFDRRHDPTWASEAVERAYDCATHFGPGSEVVDGWAGLYALTPDHHPVIEEVRPGLVVAAGFSGHGFMQSPATGQCVAELVTEGAATTVDVSGLTNDRFERGEAFEETFYSA